jgi:hypothetical protein
MLVGYVACDGRYDGVAGNRRGAVAVAQVAQRYLKVGAPSFVWEVVSIGVDLQGIRHCQIVDVNDRTNVKLISEPTLTNRRFYRLIAEGPPTSR